ncbi:MAG: lytic transglycosylase domain-containing protein [Oscillospiraceae bacterium]|nr:lytic transglycosylase domain-containing protein [Oscillospiraceae bacterium]
MKRLRARPTYIAITLCFFAAVAAMSAVTCRSVMKAVYPVRYEDAVLKYSVEYGLDASLVYAVIKTESSFDPNARSNKGALGLMQFMPDTLDWICLRSGENLRFEDLRDGETAIRCGAFMLKLLLDEFGSIETALAAYHAGRGQVNRWLADSGISSDGKTLDRIPFPDTAHYVGKVTRAIRIYEKLY